MNPLNLSSINLVSPYTVWGADEQYYFFKTDFGAIYKIGFMDDFSIWESGAYQFLIINEKNTPSPNDPKLKATIFCVLEAFFKSNPDILLYLCETGDGKQELRNRLFARWFEEYSENYLYYCRTVEIEDMDGVKNFAALIVQRSNPRLDDIIADFEETIRILTDKPEET